MDIQTEANRLNVTSMNEQPKPTTSQSAPGAPPASSCTDLQSLPTNSQVVVRDAPTAAPTLPVETATPPPTGFPAAYYPSFATPHPPYTPCWSPPPPPPFMSGSASGYPLSNHYHYRSNPPLFPLVPAAIGSASSAANDSNPNQPTGGKHLGLSTSSAVTIGTCLTVAGGLLGFTAAAAVRWLNGEDFTLYPCRDDLSASPLSPVATAAITTVQNISREQCHEQQQQQQHQEAKMIIEHMHKALESMEEQSHRHEQMMQNIIREQQRHQTNECIDLLRNGSQTNTATIRQQLDSIRTELKLLRMTTVPNYLNGQLDERLSKTLDALDTVLDEITGPDHTLAVGSPQVDGGGTATGDESNATKINDLEPRYTADDDSKTISTTTIMPPVILSEIEPSSQDVETNMPTVSAVSNENGESKNRQRPDFNELEHAIRLLANNPDTQTRIMGAQSLYLYVQNLSKNPKIPRYRTIHTTNDSYRQKVNGIPGGVELLFAIGFVDARGDGTLLEWCRGEELCLLCRGYQWGPDSLMLQRLRLLVLLVRPSLTLQIWSNNLCRS